MVQRIRSRLNPHERVIFFIIYPQFILNKISLRPFASMLIVPMLLFSFTFNLLYFSNSKTYYTCPYQLLRCYTWKKNKIQFFCFIKRTFVINISFHVFPSVAKYCWNLSILSTLVIHSFFFFLVIFFIF